MAKVSKIGKAIAGAGIGLAFFAVIAAPAYVFIPEAWGTNFYYVLGSALFVATLVAAGFGMLALGYRQKVKPKPEDQPAA